MTARELCERAAGLIYLAVRDELDDVPYVLHRDELPEPYPGAQVGGWTGATEDLRFRELIDDRIGWGGRGPLLVVSGDELPVVLAVTAHELAHVIERGWRFPEGEALDYLPAEGFMNWTSTASAEMRAEESRKAHGLQWHRALAHLVARCPFDPDTHDFDVWTSTGESYGWPAWPTIQSEFSGEVWERRREPICSILESPPPDGAAKLFEA